MVMANAMSVHDASDKTPVALVLSPVSRRRGSVSDGHVSYSSPRPARRRDAAAATHRDKGGGGGDAAPLAGGGSSGRGTPGRLHSDGRLPPVYEEFRGGGTCATASTATGGGVGGQGGEPVRAESPSHVQLPALCPRKASRFRVRPPGEGRLRTSVRMSGDPTTPLSLFNNLDRLHASQNPVDSVLCLF